MRTIMPILMIASIFSPLIVRADLTSSANRRSLEASYGVGPWIWDEQTRDRQECHFVRQFEIPRGKKILKATLRTCADNFYSLYLDGRQIGQGSDWRVLIEYDVSLLLTPGEHTIAVQAVNDFDVAGFVFGLRIDFQDGGSMAIDSDESWKIAPESEPYWKEYDGAISGWRSVKVQGPFVPKAWPQIYKAPVSQPLLVPFWQRREFQVSLMAACGAALVACLYLLSRLMMKSRTEKVMRQERARIAADLHDDLGGGVTQLVLLGHRCRQEIPEESPAAATLKRFDEQSSALLNGMNDTVWMINSQRDNTRDLASYIIRYAEDFFRQTAVRCRFDGEATFSAAHCDIRMRRNLFLAVKECFNNILKHSGASEVIVKITREKSEIVVVVSDNGRGFDLKNLTKSQGNGLANMKQRVASAGGRFDIRTSPGGGCVVEFRAPVSPQSRLWFLRFCFSNRSAASIS
jgi:signal transduction histidine kinase